MKKYINTISNWYSTAVIWGLLVTVMIITAGFLVAQTRYYQSPALALNEPCVPVITGGMVVGGLPSIDVPKLSDAQRVIYQPAGLSQYLTQGSASQILNYYLPQLAARCWNLAVLQTNEAVWYKAGKAVKVAMQENPLGGRTLVSYELVGGKVLGVSSYLAQTDVVPPPSTSTPNSGSCSSGQVWCSDSTGGGWCQTSSCPPPPQTYKAPPVPCPTGQYMCQNTCVVEGSSCNNYPYYPPGTTPPTTQQPYNTQLQQPYQSQQPQLGYPAPGNNTPTNQGMMPGQLNNPSYPGGPGGSQNFGPNEADQQKMDEQRFQMMKKGLNQFSRGITQMTKMVNGMEKKLNKMGVSIPEELKAALTKAPEIVDRIKNAKTPDELDEIQSDVQDVGSTMQEWGQKFGDLMRLGNTLKQVDKSVKDVNRTVKRSQNFAKNNENLQTAVSELNDIANSLIQAAKDAKELAKTDPDSALSKIEDDFYGKMEEFYSKAGMIDMLSHIKKGLSMIGGKLKSYERMINQLDKKKIDTTELKGSLADMQDKLAALKTLIQDPNVDPQDVGSAVEEFFGLMPDFENQVAELTGQGIYEPNVKGGEDFNFQMPQGFMSGGLNSGLGGPGGFGSGPNTGPGGPSSGPGGFGGSPGGSGMGPSGPGF